MGNERPVRAGAASGRAATKPEAFSLLEGRTVRLKTGPRGKEAFARATSTFAAFADHQPPHVWNCLSRLSHKRVQHAVNAQVLAADEAAFLRGVGQINRRHVETQLIPLYKRYLHDRVAGRADAEERLSERLGSLSPHFIDFSRPAHHDAPELRGLVVNDINRAAPAPRTPFAAFVLKESSLACRLQLLKSRPRPRPQPVVVRTEPRRETEEAVESREHIRLFEALLQHKGKFGGKLPGFSQRSLLQAERSCAHPV